jgi:hypothetical protein
MGMSILLATANNIIEHATGGDKPDVSIVPSGKALMLMAMTDFYGTYNQGGDAAVKRSTQSTDVFEMNGMKIVEAPMVQMRGTLMMADYHDIFIGKKWLLTEAPGKNDKGYYFYDDTVDQHVKLTLEQIGDALLTCIQVKHASDPRAMPSAVANFGEELNALTSMSTLFDKYSILLLQPMGRYRAQHMITACSGEELGFTYTSTERVITSTNALTQTIVYTSTNSAGGHIKDYRRVHVDRNVFYGGMVSGTKMKLIEGDVADTYKTKKFDLEENSQAASVYVVLVPKVSNADRIFVHTNGIHPRRATDANDNVEFDSKWATKYGFDKIKTSDQDAPRDADMELPIASICVDGGYYYYKDDGTKIVVPGKSHHGPLEGVGCARIRRTGMGLIPGVA